MSVTPLPKRPAGNGLPAAPAVGPRAVPASAERGHEAHLRPAAAMSPAPGAAAVAAAVASATTPPPPAALSPQVVALARLAELELETRQAQGPQTVDFIAANDTYRVVAYDHALVWRARAGRVVAVSGGVTLDGTAPRLIWFSALAKHCAATLPKATCSDIEPKTLPKTLAREAAQHIAGHALWVPFKGPAERLEGGAILVRRAIFNDAERRVLVRLGSAYGQAHAAHAARPAPRRPLLAAVFFTTASVALSGLALVPVPLAILAEARVVASNPEIVAAPLDAVVADIPVLPNASVVAGDLLVRFDRSEFAAAEAVARGRVAVLTADLGRLQQQAFADTQARGDVALARARLAEGQAELALARDRLARTEVRARTAGVVELEDRQAWLGRPVRVGERILAIADPLLTELELSIAADDALIVMPGAVVSLFLASAPADPVPATLAHVGFAPVTAPGMPAVFSARARFGVAASAAPRLGLTGTARIEGAPVSLGYALVRKPWAALRRATGW
jgi:hypothetical protein